MQGSNQAVYREHEELVFPCVKPAYREPLALVEGKGVHVTDANGKTYLDMFAGILTTSVGHCHQEVIERIHRQASRIGHTSPLYVNEQQVGVAKRLRHIAPGGLATCLFTNSGTEAVESAITLARLYTGRQEIIALRHGYSGSSTLATSLAAHAQWRPLPDSVVGIKVARSPYTYRSSLDPADSRHVPQGPQPDADVEAGSDCHWSVVEVSVFSSPEYYPENYPGQNPGLPEIRT